MMNELTRYKSTLHRPCFVGILLSWEEIWVLIEKSHLKGQVVIREQMKSEERAWTIMKNVSK